MGRPKLTPTQQRRHQVTLHLRDAELAELKRQAGSRAAACPPLPAAAGAAARAAHLGPPAAGRGGVPRGAAAGGQHQPGGSCSAPGPPL